MDGHGLNQMQGDMCGISYGVLIKWNAEFDWLDYKWLNGICCHGLIHIYNTKLYKKVEHCYKRPVVPQPMEKKQSQFLSIFACDVFVLFTWLLLRLHILYTG